MSQYLISRATIGRLPGYLNYLKSLPADTGNISATSIAKAMGLGEVQVRKDLSAVSGDGKPKIGYDAVKLIQRLESVLCTDSGGEAVIVGAGKLGKALLDYNGFEEYGLTVSAAFDKDSKKETKTEGGKSIYPSEELESYCTYHRVSIGIIATPAESAQSVCDRLIKNGVCAIWNFAPCKLEVPENIIVQNEDMALSLAHLNSKVKTIN